MSDLQNLSAPIEDTNQANQDTENKPNPEKTKENSIKILQKLKVTVLDIWDLYSQKILLAFIIAFITVITGFVGLSLLQTEKSPTPQPPQEQPQNVQEKEPELSRKFTKFEGNQYYFYFPEEYEYLTRSPEAEFNQVNFSTLPNLPAAFSLTEVADYNNPITSRDYVELKLGQNIFRLYAFEEFPTYSLHINGLLLIFRNYSVNETVFEQEILATLTPNLFNSDNLTDQYLYLTLPKLEEKVDAYINLGKPTLKPDENTLEYTTTSNLTTILKFGNDNKLIQAIGKKGNLRFDFMDSLNYANAEFDQLAVHKIITSSPVIKRTILDKNPDAEILIEPDQENEGYWLATILNSDSEDSIVIAEYRISMETGEFLQEETDED